MDAENREKITMRNNERADFFNVDYGLASIAVTTGVTIVATTEAAFHGIEIVAGDTARAVITIYDSAGGASGNIIERMNVTSADSVLNERYRPVMARKGIYIVATGEGMSGTIFYGPKG